MRKYVHFQILTLFLMPSRQADPASRILYDPGVCKTKVSRKTPCEKQQNDYQLMICEKLEKNKTFD